MMIDWPRAMECAQWAVTRPEACAAAVAVTLREARCFRNRDFPLSPVPLLVQHAAVNPLVPLLERYAQLLGTVVRRYREEPELRRWYGLGAGAERLVAADTRLGCVPWVCRLDGYLEPVTERLRILENNADAPAGTLFTSRINDVVARVLDASGIRTWELSPLTYLGDRFLRTLLKAASATDAAVPGSIAVLQPAGQANRESEEMVAEFRAAGFDAYLADPRDLTVTRGRARFGSRPADLCWNKVNTVGWRAMAADEGLVAVWERALQDTALVHVNPFGARYVAENKLTLAVFAEPRFAGLFTEAERALAATLLPWSRKVTREAVTQQGTVSLVSDLLDRQSEYVLKAPYDIRGDGVTIGYEATRAQWHSAVAAAVTEGHVAQRRVIPARYPVVTAGSSQVDVMPVSLDTFLLDGQVAGFGSKASHHAKLNIFQGGQKLAVHVPVP